MLVLTSPRKKLEICRGPEAWKALLASPPKHWKSSRTAKPLTLAWEAAAPKLPPPMAAAFAGTPFAQFEPLLAIPKYSVDLPGHHMAGTSDLFVLGQVGADLAVVMVQARVDGSLGPHLDEWLHGPYPQRLKGLLALQATLGLPDQLPGTLCYGLLQHSAAPLLEARRIGATRAAMVLAEFDHSEACYSEYQNLAALLGADGAKGRLEPIPQHSEPELWIAWVDGVHTDS